MSLTLSRPPSASAVPASAPTDSDGHRGPASPAGHAPAPPKPQHPHRDAALDFVRFACLIVVVALHSMMSGAELGAHNEVVPTVALSSSDGFAIASWFFQIMPLFFAIGGFAALSQWRRIQATGGTWADYLSARLRRLVAPVTVLIILAGLGIEVASELGVSPELIGEAGRRIGQPLWFLAVYVGLTALVPLAARLHILAPRRTVLALAGAVAVVDVLVAISGVTGLGYLNLLLVWPLIQQCGFFFHDAMQRPVRSRLLWMIAVLSVASLAGLVALGVYSPNMLVNLNPPTGALVLLGVAQIALLRLGHAWLNSLVMVGRSRSASERDARARIWDRLIAWGNKYGMHVYLWHMSVVITLIGLQGGLASLLAGASHSTGLNLSTVILPPVESAWWWLNRPVWLVLVFAASAGVAVLAAKVDAPKDETLVGFARSTAEGARLAGGAVRSLGGATRGLGGDARGFGGATCGFGSAVRGFGVSTGRHRAAMGGPASAESASHLVSVHRHRRSRASARTRQLGCAILSVSTAVVGIAIALLFGLAPFIWTAAATALLLGSLLVAAVLPSADRSLTNRQHSDAQPSDAQPLSGLPAPRALTTRSVTKGDVESPTYDGR